MPPLELNDSEMSMLLTLSAPIDQKLRPEFLRAVAEELEASRQAGEIGEGSVHRVARTIQRRYFAPRSSARPSIGPNPPGISTPVNARSCSPQAIRS